MLSYRHAYHAGNHADVLKHLVLLALFDKLLAKDKPITYIDTHSGAGLYDLKGEFAAVNAEYATGVGVFEAKQINNPLLQSYLDEINRCNPLGGAQFYPGSPFLARSVLRPVDKLHLIELHSSEIDVLRDNVGRDSRVRIHNRDAFEGLLALTPPEPRRGLALIDPSYEDKQDYKRVVSTLKKVHRRWPVGIIAIWYPLLAKQRDQGEALVRAIAREGFPDVLDIQLSVSEPQEEFGMHGSGMLILNAPWRLDDTIESALGELAPMMGDAASYRVTSL